ncbi:MAG: phage tail protein, partial [Beijerinckiaceae bacterium]
VAEGSDRPILTRAQASEQPAALSMAFIESEWDYRPAMARAEVDDPASRREAVLELAVAIPRATAQHLAETMLAEGRAARDSITLQLPASRLDVTPGDGIVHAGRRYLVQRITSGATRRLEAVGFSVASTVSAPARSLPPPVAAPRLAGRPFAVVLDLLSADSAEPVLQHLAVAADPWPGGFTLWRSDDEGAGFEPVERVSTAAVVGETLTPFAPGPLWRFDRHSKLDIRLSGGALTSVSEAAALAGTMLLAIRAHGGGWEIVSFAEAQLLGERRWRLSRFIRGLSGSEALAGVAKPAGSQVVVLDGALVPLARGTGRLGRPALYRLSPEGSDHGDPLALAYAATPGPSALLPFAPVHAKARRSAAGVTISFVRRARFGGDGWELAEVPLQEEQERYEIGIYADASLRRVLASDQPTLLYATATELADFGAAQTSLALVIRQVSAAAGPGHPAVVTIPVH